MEEFQIARAQRSQALLRLALCAVSGAGKSYGALLLAKGMVEYMLEVGALQGSLRGKIAVIDTERRSASLYAHLFHYDKIDLDPPYTFSRYEGALTALERAGFAVIILDQISHAWAGKGGALEQVDELKKSSRSDFSPWAEVSPEQNAFVDRLLSSPAHIICNMRAKSAYVMEEYSDRSGHKKTRPRKIGMAPVQRPGIEYEFTTLLDIEHGTNLASASKDRTGLFADRHVKLNEEWGKKLAHWLLLGQQADELVDRGTPLEKAEAAAGVGQRAMQRAANLPDLAREFEMALSAVRGFKALVPGDRLHDLVQDLVASKDARKEALTTAPADPPPADAISMEEAVALEEWVVSAGVAREALLAQFEIPRYGHLPSGRLQAAGAWLDRHLLSIGEPVPPMPKALVGKITIPAAPETAFAGLENDFPF